MLSQAERTLIVKSTHTITEVMFLAINLMAADSVHRERENKSRWRGGIEMLGGSTEKEREFDIGRQTKSSQTLQETDPSFILNTDRDRSFPDIIWWNQWQSKFAKWTTDTPLNL